MSTRKRTRRSKARPRPRPRTAPSSSLARAVSSSEIEALRQSIEKRRWNADAEDVQKSVAQLVLTLVEFLRQLMERQAIRRMDEGTFSDDEIERVGVALMKLEETIVELCRRFDLAPEDLQLQLGPLGRLI